MPCPYIYVNKVIFERGLITEIMDEARKSKVLDNKVV
jgi:hypothetical protein